MNRKIQLYTWGAVTLFFFGALLLWSGLRRQVILSINGQTQTLTTRALTVGDALQQAGVDLTAADRLSPAAGALLFNTPRIVLQRAYPLTLRVEPAGQEITLTTAERIPANILAEAGVPLYPGDQLEVNGVTIDPALRLPNRALTLVLRQAVPITVHDGDHSVTFYSSAASLDAALFAAGIRLQSEDQLSLPGAAPLTAGMEVSIQRARLLTIAVDGRELHSVSSAETTGGALAEAGVALQGLDYSQPAENDPLPADGAIRVVRVREAIELEQTPLPYESGYVADANTALDQRSVVTPGEYGVQVARVRVRYEDGVEVARSTEGAWTAKEPVDQVLGYGTQVVTQTVDTPDGQLEYWRAVTVYATSYSPCRSGVERCYYGTSSGLPVQRGVIAVSSAWYGWMVGQRVYIPGYGTAVIADRSGGLSNGWIDLGYTDDQYVPWSQNVTMYFLTPAPETIPWTLP